MMDKFTKKIRLSILLTEKATVRSFTARWSFLLFTDERIGEYSAEFVGGLQEDKSLCC
jgi:hypothetical protein